MREYETTYVLKPDLGGDLVKALQDKIADIIQKQEGKILVHTDWGKRKLAYRVQKLRQGQYIYLNFLDKGGSVAEIERILKYDDKVLKFLTVKLNDDVSLEERLQKPVEVPLPPPEYVEEGPSEYFPRGGGRPYRDRDDNRGMGSIEEAE